MDALVNLIALARPVAKEKMGAPADRIAQVIANSRFKRGWP